VVASRGGIDSGRAAKLSRHDDESFRQEASVRKIGQQGGYATIRPRQQGMLEQLEIIFMSIPVFDARGLRQFVGHFEKEQKRDLLRIGHVRQAVVPQNVGEVPGFGDDLLAVIAHRVLCVFCTFSGPFVRSVPSREMRVSCAFLVRFVPTVAFSRGWQPLDKSPEGSSSDADGLN
jgi:hypothetical protein